MSETIFADRRDAGRRLADALRARGLAEPGTIVAGIPRGGVVVAGRRVLALPVGPPDTLRRLEDSYDEIVTLARPPHFLAVGQWYRDFAQTTDREVTGLLESLG